MLDHVVIISDTEAMMMFDDRPPVRITSDENVTYVVDWFLRETPLSLKEYETASTGMSEDTSIINIEEVV